MVSIKSIMVAILVGGSLIMGLIGPTEAALNSISRDSLYQTTFNNPLNFANTIVDFRTYQFWHPDAQGDTTAYYWNLPAGYYHFWWIGTTGDIGVSNVVNYPNGALANITALTGLNGPTEIHYKANEGTSGTGGTIKVGVAGGFYYLEEAFVVQAGVEDHHPINWKMYLPGDWSAVGPGVGQHELLSINPAWTIDNNFTFNSYDQTTLISAHLDDYTLGNNLNIDFILHGGQVPLPSTLMLLSSGLLGLAGLRYRGRKG